MYISYIIHCYLLCQFNYLIAIETTGGVMPTAPNENEQNTNLNEYYVQENEETDIFKKLEFESEYQRLTPGGTITYLELSKIDNLEEVVKFIYENTQYVGFL